MATEGAFVQPAMPRFDGHYSHWKMIMENFPRSKEYWVVVENGVSATAKGVILFEAQKKTYEEQKLKDLKAKNYLFQALDRSILETIIKKDTSKSIWYSMKQKYEGLKWSIHKVFHFSIFFNQINIQLLFYNLHRSIVSFYIQR